MIQKIFIAPSQRDFFYKNHFMQMPMRGYDDSLEMMDDMRQQHYKSNMMDSNYASSGHMRSSMQQGPYGKPYRSQYPENLYGDVKSMYPMNTPYDSKSMYDGYGSKLNGYDGGRLMGGSNVRNSR